MSSVVIAGDTSGSVTLTAPSVAGTTTLTLPSTSGTVVTTNTMPTGSVLQVVQTVKTSTFSMTGDTFTDVTGLSVSITPSSSSNKILVFANYTLATSVADRSVLSKILRDSTVIYLADQSGTNRIRSGPGGRTSATQQVYQIGFQYLDSPATTSSVTYKIQAATFSGATLYVGMNADAADDTNRASYPAAITVMEIKG